MPSRSTTEPSVTTVGKRLTRCLQTPIALADCFAIATAAAHAVALLTGDPEIT